MAKNAFACPSSPLSDHRFDWEVRPCCSVSQNRKPSELLFELQELWRCGAVRADRSDKTLKYEMRSISDLLEIVLPHFRMYPLRSSKQKDVELFESIW